MFRKRVETSSLGHWRVFISCLRARHALAELSPGREPLVWMEETLALGDGRQPDCHYPFKDFWDVFKDDDDGKGGGGVVGGLARFVQDHPIDGFQRGGVVAECLQGGEDFEDDRGVDKVDFLPHGVGDPIGAWSAGRGELLERASLISSLVRGVAEGFFVRHPLLGRGSLGGKKWFKSGLFTTTGSEASGRQGNLGVFLGVTSCLAFEMLFGEVFAR